LVNSEAAGFERILRLFVFLRLADLSTIRWIEQSLARCYLAIARRSGRSALPSANRQFTIVRVLYHGFPSKLHHEVPNWVEDGALFHIRIAIDREKEQQSLIVPPLAEALLDSARLYETKQRWDITLFLLMPDHIHTLLSFASDQPMSRIIGDWKHFHAGQHAVKWQEGYFDHRLRDDERGEQLSVKMNYIRQNPVATGLCAKAADWPWIIDPFT
jgi:REP-associated tyrosine transposase